MTGTVRQRYRRTLYAGALLVVAAAAGLGLWSTRTSTAQPKLIPIGYLSPNGAFYRDEVFVKALAALGYVDGQNISLIVRRAEGHSERLQALADELVQSQVRVLVAVNVIAAQAAQKATQKIPIVFMAVGLPESAGLVQSLQRPGGNITGIANFAADMRAKRLEILRDALPSLRRIALLYRAGTRREASLEQEVATAQSYGFEAHLYTFPGPESFDGAFATMAADGMELAVLDQDAVLVEHAEEVSATAHRAHLPLSGISYIDVSHGTLLAYHVARPNDITEAAAGYVAKILRGADPARLPVSQPVSFALTVNPKAAETFGLHLSPTVLLRADEVIE